MPTSAPILPGYDLLSDSVGGDGRRLVTLRTPPAAPGTPAPKAAPLPAGWRYWPSPGPVWAADSNRWVVSLRADVVPAPPPVTPPAPVPPPVTPPVVPVVVPAVTLPAVTRNVPKDPAAVARGFGLNEFAHVADQVYADREYDGWEQNSCQNFKGGLTLRNYRGLNGWSETWNYSQGIYISSVVGKVVIDGAVLAFNGRPQSQPDFTPTGKRHGAYHDGNNGPLSAAHLILINNACAGVQTRTDADAWDLFSFGNSLPLLHVMGRLNVRRATIVAPSLHHDGTNWAGGAAVTALWPVTLDDVWLIGMDGQATPPTSKPGRVFPNAAVSSGGSWSNDSHPVWTAPPDDVPLIRATNCVLSGQWPGGNFGGAKPHDGSGFTLAPNNVPASLGAQILAVYRQVVGPAPMLSIIDAVAKLHSLARGAALSANPSLATPPAAPSGRP